MKILVGVEFMDADSILALEHGLAGFATVLRPRAQLNSRAGKLYRRINLKASA